MQVPGLSALIDRFSGKAPLVNPAPSIRVDPLTERILRDLLREFSTTLPIQRFNPYQAYTESVLVKAPVWRKAAALAALPIRVYQGDPHGYHKEVEPNHPARRALQYVNPLDSHWTLWFATSGYLDLRGHAPWLVDMSGQPAMIHVLRPDLVKVLAPEPGEFLPRFEYGPAGAAKKVFSSEEVVWFRNWNPGGITTPLSNLQPASDAIAINELMKDFQEYVIQNLGDVGGWLEPSGDRTVPITDDQAREMVDKFMEANAGARKVGKPGILPRGWQYRDSKRNPRDLEFGEGRREMRREASSAFGTPPIMQGDYHEASKLANAEVQRTSFWKDTMLPTIEGIEAVMNSEDSGFFWRFGAGVFGKFDVSGVEELQEDRAVLDARWSNAVARGVKVTQNEYRERILGLPPLEDAEGGEEFITQPSAAVGGFSLGRRASRPKATSANVRPLVVVAERALAFSGASSDLIRSMHWKTLDSRWRREEPLWKSELAEFFGEQEERVLRRLRGQGSADLLTADWLLPREEESEEMASVVSPLEARAVALGGRSGAEAIREAMRANRRARIRNRKTDDVTFNELSPEVARYTLALEQKLVEQVTATTWESIKAELLEGQEAGESIAQIRARLEGIFGARRSQADLERIARTEIVKASNGGSLLAYQQSGVVERKEWLTSRDAAVRDAHQAMEGQVVGLGDRFVDGDQNQLEFPGDPSAPAATIINCRCTHIPVITEEAA